MNIHETPTLIEMPDHMRPATVNEIHHSADLIEIPVSVQETVSEIRVRRGLGDAALPTRGSTPLPENEVSPMARVRALGSPYKLDAAGRVVPK